MRSRTAHPAVCLVVLTAIVLNFVLAAGGAVLCRVSGAPTRLEFACDHGHCDTGVVALADDDEHQHDSSESCRCSTCPCEDTSLGVVVAGTLSRDDQQGAPASIFECVLWSEEAVMPPDASTSFVMLCRPPPAVARQLGQLRTIVLIV